MDAVAGSHSGCRRIGQLKANTVPAVEEYTAAELSDVGLDRQRLPRHVAIIMDGNGRWAKARGLPIGANWRP